MCPKQLLIRIKAEVDSFFGTAAQFDDLTMLVIKLLKQLDEKRAPTRPTFYDALRHKFCLMHFSTPPAALEIYDRVIDFTNIAE